MNIDDPVAKVIPASFKHDGGIQHQKASRRVSLGLGGLLKYTALDVGERHLLQSLALFGAGKNDSAKLPANDFSLSVKHRATPAPADHFLDLGLAQSLMAKGIANEDETPITGQ